MRLMVVLLLRVINKSFIMCKDFTITLRCSILTQLNYIFTFYLKTWDHEYPFSVVLYSYFLHVCWNLVSTSSGFLTNIPMSYIMSYRKSLNILFKLICQYHLWSFILYRSEISSTDFLQRLGLRLFSLV